MRADLVEWPADARAEYWEVLALALQRRVTELEKRVEGLMRKPRKAYGSSNVTRTKLRRVK